MDYIDLEKLAFRSLLALGMSMFLTVVVSMIVSWYRLRHIPGPWLASVSNIWMIRAATSKRLSEAFERAGSSYGPLVRIGPNQILTSDADFLRKTGAVRGAYTRSQWYAAFRWQPYVDSVFNFSDYVSHDTRRAQISTAYNITGHEVDLIEPSIDEQILLMLHALRTKYVPKHDKPNPPLLDFSDFSSFLTMDVITRAAFGEEFGHLRSDSDVTGFLTQLREHWAMISLVNETPFLRSLFCSKMWLRLFGPNITDAGGIGKLMSGVVRIVHQRYAKPETQLRNDMLQESEAEGMQALIAGSETTASVMRITFLCLISSPPIYNKLKEAVREAIESGNVTEPISYNMAREIPYLRAVVYEGMRMRPGTTGSFSKVVPPQGEVVQGKFIPGGTLVAMNVPAMLRSAELFGSDAHLFRPERWLQASGDKQAEMKDQVEMMFGSGRWMCAGKPITYMELFKTFFELFRHFDFMIAYPDKPWNSKCYNVYVEDNMWIKVAEAA
ncbi:cytochrome P450 [Diaporthe helianthi]|uniref:Cytochrome P450 n=1 Tax=Diaporthe helianthi TaxID=158607 RepID=A0A2P5HZ22_DIAHE|nr:cytochrome P450 [Diaporthe helianthi]